MSNGKDNDDGGEKLKNMLNWAPLTRHVLSSSSKLYSTVQELNFLLVSSGEGSVIDFCSQLILLSIMKYFFN